MSEPNFYAVNKSEDTERKRIRAIASALACSAIWEELCNPSGIASDIMGYNPERDFDAVYREFGNIYDGLQAEMIKATNEYLNAKWGYKE